MVYSDTWWALVTVKFRGVSFRCTKQPELLPALPIWLEGEFLGIYGLASRMSLGAEVMESIAAYYRRVFSLLAIFSPISTLVYSDVSPAHGSTNE
jgi:hypothetical protein